MTTQDAIKKTAKYFSISEEKAAEMIHRQSLRDKATAERAALMLKSVEKGQSLRGGIGS